MFALWAPSPPQSEQGKGVEPDESAASKVMWVGRATVFMLGLAVIVGLVVGLASMALGADADFFKIGRLNEAASTSTLNNRVGGVRP